MSSALIKTAETFLETLKLHFYNDQQDDSNHDQKIKLLDRQNWKIEGSDKLYRRIEQEIKFLIQNPESQSSNISSLKEIAEYGIDRKDNLVAFLRPYSCTLCNNNNEKNSSSSCSNISNNNNNEHEEINQSIDLILTQKNENSFKSKQLVWTKLIARKGTSIHEHCLGRSDSKNRNILDQAIDIAKLSRNIKYNFSSVKVNFVFTRGVTNTVKEMLETKLNISCQPGKIGDSLELLPDPYETDKELIIDEFFDEDHQEIISVPEFHFYSSDRVNLDVTTMLSYCTNLTHGSEILEWESQKYQFIAIQAQDERRCKVRPIIDSYMENKKLVVTKTAISEFKNIISKVGGPEEKLRAENLLKICTIIEDNPSKSSLQLPTSSKMSDRSINIFGTADSLNIPTITGNVGFVRAAGQNGVDFCVLVHEPRVLTEQKEMTYF